MQIHELTALARQMKASDIHISEGLPLMFRIDGRLVNAPVQMSADETRSLILGLMDEAHLEAVTTERIDADFALVAPDGTRSRVNVFYQQNKAAATLRLLNNSIPTLAELSMPPVLTKLADEPRGLILVTGPTGSGKSTTLAAMIDHINETRSDHIITIENPSSMSIRASRRSSTSAKSGRTCPALPPPCAALCVRTRTSFWSARCATMRRSPPLLPPPRPATWS